jgi:hypothetical protein
MKSFEEYQVQRAGEELAERLAYYGIDPDEFCDNVLEVCAACNEAELYNELLGGLRNVAQGAMGGLGQAWQGAKDMAGQAWQGARDMAGQAWQGAKQGMQNVGNLYQQGEQGAQLQRAKAAVQQLDQQLKQMGYNSPGILGALQNLIKHIDGAAAQVAGDPSMRLGAGSGAFGKYNA